MSRLIQRLVSQMLQVNYIKEPLINVGEAASTRQNQVKKRSLYLINEHFEPDFNDVMATQVVNQRFLRVNER